MYRYFPLHRFSKHFGVRYTECKPNPYYGPPVVQRTDMLNGMKVAAAKHLGAPIGACTIMFQVDKALATLRMLRVSKGGGIAYHQTGSRCETYDQKGVTHFLRAMTSSSSHCHSAFAKMRVLQRRGASITTTSDRQTIAFTLRCTPVDFPELKHYLLDASLRCYYHDWEVRDIKPFIRDNLLRISPEERILDLIQTAVWFGPFGNSTYCDEDRIDDISSEHLKDFVKNYACDHCTVASVGFPHEETLKLAQLIEFEHDRPCCIETTCSYPRRGAMYHDLGQGSDTWIAVAVPGFGTCDFRQLMMQSILAATCGAGNSTMGQHAFDRIPQTPLGSHTEDPHTDMMAFNISYVESGVFGILAKTKPSTAEKVARRIVKFLANADKISPEHIEVGKRRLKLGLALHEEDCVQVAEGLALQLANNVKVDGPHDAFALIDGVTDDEVLDIGKQIGERRSDMAMAVVGDVSSVPLDVDLMRGFL